MQPIKTRAPSEAKRLSHDGGYPPASALAARCAGGPGGASHGLEDLWGWRRAPAGGTRPVPPSWPAGHAGKPSPRPKCGPGARAPP